MSNASDRQTRRQQWHRHRQSMEENRWNASLPGGSKKSGFFLIRSLIAPLSQLLKLAYPVYLRGKRNALNLCVVESEHHFKALPSAFDGLKIMHLSDLHLDERPELADKIIAAISGLSYDLCIFTGDYFSFTKQAPAFMPQLSRVIASIDPAATCYGILGNHDSHKLVAPLEGLGLRLLINENDVLTKGGQSLQIIGTDDVYDYFTQNALDALSSASDHFTIALVHSPEIFDYAESEGVDLYLCGHTHGGQIRLAKNVPLVKHLRRGHDFYSQRWCHKEMLGYTSHGVGTSTIPLRYHTTAEISLHTLIKAG